MHVTSEALDSRTDRGESGGNTHLLRLWTPGILVVAEKSLAEGRVGWMRVALKSGDGARATVDAGARRRGAVVSRDLLRADAVKDMWEETATTSLNKHGGIYTKKAGEKLVFWKVLDGVECGLFSGEVERQRRGVKFRGRVRAGRGSRAGAAAGCCEGCRSGRAPRAGEGAGAGHKGRGWYSQAVR